MLFLLVCGAVLQAVIPTGYLVGHARLPVLLGLVVYYALTRRRGPAMRAALLAGFFQDGLSLIPLGYSSFVFCLVAWLINSIRDEVYIHHWTTHVVCGALGNGFQAAILYILLTQAGNLALPASGAALKMGGALCLGAFTVPVIFKAAQTLEEKLGLVEAGSIA
jgi:rod shape-determining protein MreD